MNQTYKTKNFPQTQKIGESFASKLHGGDILLLSGELGAGKTTFIQGLAKGLGITHRIISPTFIIMRTYEVKNNTSINRLYHIDLYRTQTEEDLKGIGLEEIFQDKKAVIAIEWPEKLGSFKPHKYWKIALTVDRDEEHEMSIEKK